MMQSPEHADVLIPLMHGVISILLSVVIALLAFIYKRLTEQLTVVKAYNHNLVTVMFRLMAALHPTKAPLITAAMTDVLAGPQKKSNGQSSLH